ncbi:MAG: hypothetical protein LBS34_00860 [Rickettsiales bacterium]|jgi:hypothetical protein|nr:hypothetical protein [Rickettsiales bacterium]
MEKKDIIAETTTPNMRIDVAYMLLNANNNTQKENNVKSKVKNTNICILN